ALATKSQTPRSQLLSRRADGIRSRVSIGPATLPTTIAGCAARAGRSHITDARLPTYAALPRVSTAEISPGSLPHVASCCGRAYHEKRRAGWARSEEVLQEAVMEDGGWTASADAWIARMGEHGDDGRRYVLDPALLARIEGRTFARALDVGCG